MTHKVVSITVCKRCGKYGKREDFLYDGENVPRCGRCGERGWYGIEEKSWIEIEGEYFAVN